MCPTSETGCCAGARQGSTAKGAGAAQNPGFLAARASHAALPRNRRRRVIALAYRLRYLSVQRSSSCAEVWGLWLMRGGPRREAPTFHHPNRIGGMPDGLDHTRLRRSPSWFRDQPLRQQPLIAVSASRIPGAGQPAPGIQLPDRNRGTCECSRALQPHEGANSRLRRRRRLTAVELQLPQLRRCANRRDQGDPTHPVIDRRQRRRSRLGPLQRLARHSRPARVPSRATAGAFDSLPDAKVS